MTSKWRKLSRTAIPLCWVVVAVWLAGCDDPIGPNPKPVSYDFYGLDGLSSRRVLRLAPSTCAIDTVSDSLPASLRSNVSADGRFLYVSLGDSLMVFTTESGQFVRTLHNPTQETASSPNGKLLALLNRSLLGLTIMSLPSYCVRFSDDTLNVSAGIFSSDSRTFYCLIWGTPHNEIMCATIGRTIHVERKTIPAMPGALTRIVPSRDEKLWYLYSCWNSFGYSFGVYDVAADSLIYRQDLTPGPGGIVVAPDSKTVFFTNEGSMISDLAPSAFYIYDVPSNSVSEVSTLGLAGGPEDPLKYQMPIGSMAITPDGKTLVGVRSIIGNDLVVFDVRSRTITGYCNFNVQALFYDITCQAGR